MLTRLPLWSAALLVFAVTLPVSSALAEPGQRDRERQEQRRAAFQEKLLKDLDLDDAQKQAFGEVMAEHREDMQAWRDYHAEEIEALRTAFREAREDRDRERARELRDEMKALHDGRPKLEDRAGDLKAVLSDAQAAQLDENIAEIREDAQRRMEDRKQKRSERRDTDD